jgi:hypothetical protein
MTKRLVILLALTVAGLVGCSKEAEEKCNEFESAFCDRVSTCTSTAKASCMAELAKKADCSTAQDVPADFDKKCIPALKALECSNLTAIPEACNIKVGS